MFAEPLFEKEEDGVMRGLLVDEVARRYWGLMEGELKNVKMILDKAPLFEVALNERMAVIAKGRYDGMFG